jgi:hypothetical protein
VDPTLRAANSTGLGYSSVLNLQAALKRSQGIQRVIQGLIFLDGIVAAGKEFAGSGDDGVLGFCNAEGSRFLSASNKAAR